MGSSPSKPLSGDLKTYMEHSSDSLLVINKCMEDMSASKMDNTISKYMTDAERTKFTKLMQRKELLVDDVDMFVRKENRRYKDILASASKGERYMHKLFKNNGTQAQITACENLLEKLTELKLDMKAFHDELRHAMQIDGRLSRSNGEIAGWLGTFVAVTGVIATIVVVIVALCGGPVGAVAAWGYGIAAGLSVVGTAAVALSPTESQRALDYMQDLTTNLKTMKEALMAIKADNRVLLDDEEVHTFTKTIEELIKRTDNITLLCSQARK